MQARQVAVTVLLPACCPRCASATLCRCASGGSGLGPFSTGPSAPVPLVVVECAPPPLAPCPRVPQVVVEARWNLMWAGRKLKRRFDALCTAKERDVRQVAPPPHRTHSPPACLLSATLLYCTTVLGWGAAPSSGHRGIPLECQVGREEAKKAVSGALYREGARPQARPSSPLLASNPRGALTPPPCAHLLAPASISVRLGASSTHLYSTEQYSPALCFVAIVSAGVAWTSSDLRTLTHTRSA